tara:strand:- start:174 stop:530 length:357 start_codon:yes stop_codon:yes gene_type:complete
MHPQRNLIESAQMLVEDKLQSELLTAFAHHYDIPQNHEKFDKITKNHIDMGSLAQDLVKNFYSEVNNIHMSKGIDSNQSSLRGAGHVAAVENKLTEFRKKLTGERPERISFLRDIGLK